MLELILFHASTFFFACLKAGIAGTALTLFGFVVTPEAVRRHLDFDWLDLLILGATIFVVGCWIVVRHDLYIVPVIVLLLIGGPILLAVRIAFRGRQGRQASRDPSNRLKPAETLLPLFGFFSLIVYLVHYWQLRPDMLPFIYSGSLDVMQYSNTAMSLRDASSSLHGNIAGYDFKNFATRDVFGAFSLISLLQSLPQQGLYDFAIPAVLLTKGGCCLVVYFCLRDIFDIRPRAALTIVSLSLANPLNFYAVYNYFFSQMLATFVVTCIACGALRRHEKGLSIGKHILATFPGYILLLFCYSPGLPLAFAVHFVLLVALETLRRDKPLLEGFFRRSSLISAASIVGLMVLTLAALVALFPVRSGYARDQLVAYAIPGIGGWPLSLLSALVLVGIGPIDRTFEGFSILNWISFLLVVPIAVAAPFLLHVRNGSVSRDRHSPFAAGIVFGCLLLGYIVYYAYVGRSYQQWKFASYGPTAFCWIALAQMLWAIERLGHRLQNRQWLVPASRPALAAVVLILDLRGTLEFPPIQVPSDIKTISAIDGMNIDRIALDLDRQPSHVNYANQTLGPSYIRRPRLYMAWGLAYLRSLPNDYHPSPDFPLLTKSDNCGKPGAAGIEPLRNGFRLVTRSALPLGTVVDFKQPFCAGLIDVTGVGNVEANGRWTEGNEARFLLHIDPKQIDGDLDIALTAAGFKAPAAPEQTAEVIVNGNSLTVWRYNGGEAETHEVTVPHATAIERPDLEVTLRLPHATSLAAFSGGADQRVVALMLQTLAIGNLPPDSKP